MSERRDHDNVGLRAAAAPAGTTRHHPTGAGPGVGKLTRVQAELGSQRATASSVAPVAHEPSYAPPTDSQALGPANEQRSVQPGNAGAARPGVWQQLASTAPGHGGTAHTGSAASAGQSAQPATPAAPAGKSERTSGPFELAHEEAVGPVSVKLRAKFLPRDGITAQITKGAAGDVGPATFAAKIKVDEFKAVMSTKGVGLQETLASVEAGVTLFEGMKLTIKLSTFEVKLPLDYSLLKLSFEGDATDVGWFAGTSWARDLRIDVNVSGSIAIDQKLLLKIMAELAPFQKAAEIVKALELETAEAARKVEAATRARDAAKVEQAVAKQAEGTVAKAKKLAVKAERAAEKAERVAVTAEARAIAQAERATARAVIATATADAKAARLASSTASRLLRIEEAALAQEQRVFKGVASRLKAATSTMHTAASKIKNVLAKKIAARIGKVLATRVGQTLLKAIPVVGALLLAKDVLDIANWLINLSWDGGRFYGQDGAGAGDGGYPAANPGPVDAAPPASAGGVDADGGDADRRVDGAGTTGVDQTGAATPTTKPATPTTAPAIQVPTPAATPMPAPARPQATAPTPSSGHDDHATQHAGQGKHGNGGSGSGGSGNGVGNGSTSTAPESQPPTTVSATGSSAPTGATATETKTPTPTGDASSDASRDTVDHDAQVGADHDAKDAADHDVVADSRDVATSASQQSQSAPTPARVQELKRKANAKAERKAKAAAEAAERKKAANEAADRRLFWGGDTQILGALYWDGTTLTKNAKVLNTFIAEMQQQPRRASNGAPVALRRMQVTIGKPLGTQIPVEVKYLAEQQQGAQWIPCAQDVQTLLFDTPSKQLRVAGIGMHAVLFDGGVLQVKNGQVVKARETFTMAGLGTFQIAGLDPDDKGDYWAVTVTLKPLNIFDRKATFQVEGGAWHELGSQFVKENGIPLKLNHSKIGAQR